MANASNTATAGAVATRFCNALNTACRDKYTSIQRQSSQLRSARQEYSADSQEGFAYGARPPRNTFRYAEPPESPTRFPEISFRVSPNEQSSFRTPAEQALEVAKGGSSTCWGAHMTGKAKHILPTADKVVIYSGDKLEVLLGEYLPWFKDLWAAELRRADLLNYERGQVWPATIRGQFTDQLHVELRNARLPQSDPLVEACVDEYARLMNQGGYQRNMRMEVHLEPALATRLQQALNLPQGH